MGPTRLDLLQQYPLKRKKKVAVWLTASYLGWPREYLSSPTPLSLACCRAGPLHSSLLGLLSCLPLQSGQISKGLRAFVRTYARKQASSSISSDTLLWACLCRICQQAPVPTKLALVGLFSFLFLLLSSLLSFFLSSLLSPNCFRLSLSLPPPRPTNHSSKVDHHSFRSANSLLYDRSDGEASGPGGLGFGYNHRKWSAHSRASCSGHKCYTSRRKCAQRWHAGLSGLLVR